MAIELLQQYQFIYIDGELINPSLITKLELEASIDSVLPTLRFAINDTRGDIWSTLHFGIGSDVQIALGTTSEKDSEMDAVVFAHFCITRMYNGHEYGNSTLGGYIQVWCEQAWKFYENYDDHAYEKQKLGKLIKEICSNTMKRAQVLVKNENFEESMDTGSIRYKLSTGDLDFITGNLLPSTLIGDSNSYFFLDQYGYAKLSSFEKLYKKKPQCLITPQMDIISDKTNGIPDQLAAYLQNKNYKYYIPFDGSISNIGSRADIDSMLNQINEKIYLYDNQNQVSMIAWQTPSLKAGTSSGTLKQSSIPVMNKVLSTGDATSSNFFENYPIEDQIAFSRNNDVSTNDIFSTVIGIRGYDSNLSVGDTVDLWLPSFKNIETEADPNTEEDIRKQADKVSVHWLSGKWLISRVVIKHVSASEVMTLLKIIRPTFVISTKTTSLNDYRVFYDVEGAVV